MAVANGSPKCMYIDGQWCKADGGRTLTDINPATEEGIAEVAYGGQAETRRAIEAAARALPAWMKLTAYERARFLKKTADLIRDRADTIARTMTMEQGKPLAESKAETLHTADTFEWFAEEGKRTYGEVIPPSVAGKRHMVIKHPVGVVGSHQPLELPHRPAIAQDRPGHGRRLHGGQQTGQPDAVVPDPGVRVPGRGRSARGRRQPGHGTGPGDRRRVRPQSRWSAKSALPDRPRSASS